MEKIRRNRDGWREVKLSRGGRGVAAKRVFGTKRQDATITHKKGEGSMKRYLAMLGMVTLLAVPTVVGADAKQRLAREEFPQLYGTTQPTESVTKGVITEQEPVEVPAPVTTAPAKAKTDQERSSGNPYLENGLNW
jgi:hypothetical protein